MGETVTARVTFSNPRLAAEFSDWPNGRERCRCKFFVEGPGARGWRIGRKTTDRRGQWCKPKYLTYGGPCCIVDGSDGKTYLLTSSPDPYGASVTIYDHSCQYNASKAATGIDHFAMQQYSPDLYAELAGLITQATGYAAR